MTNGSADLLCWASPLQNILKPSPEQFAIGSFNQHRRPERGSARRGEPGRDAQNRTVGWCASELAIIFPPCTEGRDPSSDDACPSGAIGTRPDLGMQ